MRTPSIRAQKVSTISQLDGPESLPMRDPIGRWMHGVSRSVEQDSSQVGTYVQRASAPRRRKYPGGDGDNDGSRRPYRDWRPPERRYPNQGGRPPDQGGYPDGGLPGDGGPPGGGYPTGMGDPLEEDTLAEDLLMETPWRRTPLEMEDLLMMEDPLYLLVYKDHQALKDHLDQ